MLRPKQNSYKEFDNEKKFLRLNNSPPHPPYNFFNGPSLKAYHLSRRVFVAFTFCFQLDSNPSFLLFVFLVLITVNPLLSPPPPPLPPDYSTDPGCFVYQLEVRI